MIHIRHRWAYRGRGERLERVCSSCGKRQVPETVTGLYEMGGWKTEARQQPPTEDS